MTGSLRLLWIALLAGFAVLPGGGCRLIDGLADLPPSVMRVNKIPRLQPPPDAIALDIIFVERPEGDRLLGTDLWPQVDEVSSLDLATRNRLRENGFRVGVVGSRPPVALQTLLGLRTDFAAEPDAEKQKLLIGRQIMLRSGGETEIQATHILEQCRVKLRGEPDSPTRDYTLARGLFRVRVDRQAEGWTRLEFTPQIHHGQHQLRHVAGDQTWMLNAAQESDTYHHERFAVNLSVGEMAVVSTQPAPQEAAGTCTLGRMFFVGSPADPTGQPGIQRLLVIRVSNMPQEDDPWQESVETSSSTLPAIQP